MGEPGFWDDQDRAAAVSAEHARTQRKVEEFNTLEADLGDLETMEEMAAEDASIAAEVDDAERFDRLAPGDARGGAPVRRASTTTATRWSP